MALDEHLVPAARMRFAPEEVVEADLVERRGRGVGRDMAADAHARPLRAVHHDGRVPPDPGPVATFDILVAGEPGLQLGRDRVDVVGGRQRRDGHPLFTGAFQQPQHQIARPRRAGSLQQLVEGLQPLRCLFGVDVGQIGSHALADHPNSVGFACAAWIFGQVVARELGGQLPLLLSAGFLILGDRPFIVPHRRQIRCADGRSEVRPGNVRSRAHRMAWPFRRGSRPSAAPWCSGVSPRR